MGNGVANAYQLGWANQTPANQVPATRGSRAAPTRKRRAAGKKKAARAAKPARKKRRASRTAKFVKGSAAAKRYMAKLRAMRKK